MKILFIYLLLAISSSFAFAYEAKCILRVSFQDIPMNITVKDKILKEYNSNTNKVIGIKKYLGKTDKGYYVYGEDPKDFLVNIYLGPINNGKFRYIRFGTYNNKVQWSGECKLVN